MLLKSIRKYAKEGLFLISKREIGVLSSLLFITPPTSANLIFHRGGVWATIGSEGDICECKIEGRMSLSSVWKKTCLFLNSQLRQQTVKVGIAKKEKKKEKRSSNSALLKGHTSEGNFLFGEVAAKEFPVWADVASWLEGFLDGKRVHNGMTN